METCVTSSGSVKKLCSHSTTSHMYQDTGAVCEYSCSKEDLLVQGRCSVRAVRAVFVTSECKDKCQSCM